MSLYAGFIQLGAGLSVGLAGLAAGFAIGIVGDAGVRGTAQQPRLFIGMVSVYAFKARVMDVVVANFVDSILPPSRSWFLFVSLVADDCSFLADWHIFHRYFFFSYSCRSIGIVWLNRRPYSQHKNTRWSSRLLSQQVNADKITKDCLWTWWLVKMLPSLTLRHLISTCDPFSASLFPSFSPFDKPADPPICPTIPTFHLLSWSTLTVCQAVSCQSK